MTPPAKIALVTDSTCDLPEADLARYSATIVPLHVTVGGISYLDRTDLTTTDFHRLFRQAGQVAHSSQPSVGEFAHVYASLLESHESVVSIHISGRLSGAVQAAHIAADAVDPGRVRVVDSRQVSVGLGLVVQAAAEAILAGRTLEEVAAAAEAAAHDTRVYGATPSLEAAVKGGRVRPPVARIADLVDLKPIIVFDEEGGAHADGGHLGFSRALAGLADRVVRFADGTPFRLAIAHADGADAARRLLERLRLLLGNVDVPILEAGAVITTHVGLGAVAAAVRRNGARPDIADTEGAS